MVRTKYGKAKHILRPARADGEVMRGVLSDYDVGRAKNRGQIS
jgi:hypothetical protein